MWQNVPLEKTTVPTLEVLRRLFGPKKDEVMGENYITRSFVICTLPQV
jgi:hypothetical protein